MPSNLSRDRHANAGRSRILSTEVRPPRRSQTERKLAGFFGLLGSPLRSFRPTAMRTTAVLMKGGGGQRIMNEWTEFRNQPSLVSFVTLIKQEIRKMKSLNAAQLSFSLPKNSKCRNFFHYISRTRNKKVVGVKRAPLCSLGTTRKEGRSLSTLYKFTYLLPSFHLLLGARGKDGREGGREGRPFISSM